MNWSPSYLYTSADVRAYAPARPGLYRLRIDLGHIFYIGQSENVQRRLLEHFQTREKNRRLKRCLDAYPCYFEFVELPDGSDLLQAERDEILKYKPYANTAEAPPVVGRYRK